MQAWAALQFCFLLTVAIGVIAVIVAELKIVERAEKAEIQGLLSQFRADIDNLR